MGIEDEWEFRQKLTDLVERLDDESAALFKARPRFAHGSLVLVDPSRADELIRVERFCSLIIVLDLFKENFSLYH